MTRRPFKVLFRSQYLSGSDVELLICGQMIVISSIRHEGFQNEFLQSMSFNSLCPFTAVENMRQRVKNCNIGAALNACPRLRL
jgi:hypothetical protein